jgi:hypothetical protein
VLFIKDGEVYNQITAATQAPRRLLPEDHRNVTALSDGGVAGD